jgi:hypothetical protein
VQEGGEGEGVCTSLCRWRNVACKQVNVWHGMHVYVAERRRTYYRLQGVHRRENRHCHQTKSSISSHPHLGSAVAAV